MSLSADDSDSSRRARRQPGTAVIVCCVASGVVHNVTFVLAGRALAGHPWFLLCSTTAASALIYGLWSACAAFRVRGPSRTQRVACGWWWYPTHCAGISALVVLSGTAAQLANVHVSGLDQTLLNQLALPLTVLASRVATGTRCSRQQALGVAIVTAASLLPLVLGGGAGGGAGWLLVFALSQVPAAAVSVWEQTLLSRAQGAPLPLHSPELLYLTATSVLALAGYAGLALVAWFCLDGVAGARALAEEQARAVLALVGTAVAPLVVCGYVASQVVYYHAHALLARRGSASFQPLADSLVAPLSAVALVLLAQGGDRTRAAQWALLAVSCCGIGAGVWMFATARDVLVTCGAFRSSPPRVTIVVVAPKPTLVSRPVLRGQEDCVLIV